MSRIFRMIDFFIRFYLLVPRDVVNRSDIFIGFLAQRKIKKRVPRARLILVIARTSVFKNRFPKARMTEDPVETSQRRGFLFAFSQV